MKLKRLAYVLICVFLIGCTANNRVYEIYEIPDNAIERMNDTHIYLIRFSNLIYTSFRTEKKKIKIPIFQGYLDDVKYGDFLSYCREKKMLESNVVESGFAILTKKGEVKKTLLEFIKFYEGNILKGYEKSVEMYTSGDEPQYLMWEIVYKFKVDNIPCLMEIYVEADERDFAKPDELFKSIEDIHINEDMEAPSFVYDLTIDYRPRE